ncbi:MAG TPA: STAS domain-containing protein [Gammaproteobacteria bacterium]
MKASLTYDQGMYRLSGVLDFQSVVALRDQDIWSSGEPDIDLANVTHSNSAGIALLLEWLKLAQQKGVQIKYHNLPESLGVIARAYGVDQALPVTP